MFSCVFGRYKPRILPENLAKLAKIRGQDGQATVIEGARPTIGVQMKILKFFKAITLLRVIPTMTCRMGIVR